MQGQWEEGDFQEVKEVIRKENMIFIVLKEQLVVKALMCDNMYMFMQTDVVTSCAKSAEDFSLRAAAVPPSQSSK